MAADPWAEFDDAPPATLALERLRQRGVTVTNGFRTDEDVRRIRRQGYKPAPDGPHNKGDGVDLAPGKSGLSMRQLEDMARREFDPDARIVNEGHHVHAAVPGWGYAPDTTRADPWDAFPDAPGGSTKPSKSPVVTVEDGGPVGARPGVSRTVPLSPDGSVRDGDTFGLSSGQNGRLYGVDAFELKQAGRTRSGEVVPLGTNARNALVPFATPRGRATPTGGVTYGRPVVSLDNGGDAGEALLRQGWALAAPEYLRNDPVAFRRYMEAERLGRANLLGAHGNTYQTPESFRAGNPDPWEKPETAAPGEKGTAVFADEPTPFMGLRPEIEQGYLAIWNDPKSKPEDLLAYAKVHGFTIRPEDVRKGYAKRFKGGDVADSDVAYVQPPRPVTDLGDGRLGAATRGLADPFNALDELGAIADTVGVPTLGGPRENIWNSDRRFGDILWNNIDQNRSILAHDDLTHPYYRLGGQIASGIVAPYGAGVRSVPGLMRLGAAEGFAAGLGAGEGGLVERFPNAAVGAGLGMAGGAALGGVVSGAPVAYRFLRGRNPVEVPEGGSVARDAAFEAAPVVDDGAQASGPTPASRIQPQGGVLNDNAPWNMSGIREWADDVEANSPTQAIWDARADNGNGAWVQVPKDNVRSIRSAAMEAGDEGPELVGPVAPLDRERDYLRVGRDPWAEFQDAPFGVARPMNERLSPEEMARLAEGVDPASVLPRPGNQVESLDEAIRANPGRFAELEAPNPLKELPVRNIPSRSDLYKSTKVRGPLDVTQRLRSMGGIRDDGGELSHAGITNEPRRLPFGGGEQFLGRLVDNERGMPLDEATFRLWEEGYFPEFNERPTPNDLLDALKLEAMGQRRFHPEEQPFVERFYGAQAEADRINRAADEGAPLVEERGHTINLDDLVANTPPAAAYEELPRLTGKIGNINLDRLERPQDVAALIDQIGKRVGGFSAAARGRITNEETQRLAQDLGVRPEQLLRRRQGQALNAEQLYASRALVQRSREAVAQMAKRAVGGSDDDLATFRKAWLKHVALEEQIAGSTAEAGRALQQFKMLARAQDSGANAVRSYLKGAGGRESIEDAAEKIVELMEDPARAGHFMREAVKPKWRDKFNELWINSLLSGPRTHVVNFVGNALTTALSFPELALTAGIGKLTRSADRAYFRELGARAAGLADSSVEALRAMRQAFKSGEAADETSKVDAVHQRAIGGRLGHVLRTPTRALTAADEFWKTLLSSAELRQLAYRQAIRETGGGDAFTARYEGLLRAPPESMTKQAQAAARYYTFQKELGRAGRGIQEVSNNWVGGKILLPFVRTPINLLKFAGERSVLGLALPEVRAALKAGGRQRDEALARITLGSGLSTAAVVAAMDGRITGSGPSDPRERASWLETHQPYSIKVGDQWVSYGRFDPVSTLFGVAADFAEVGKWATKREADALGMKLGVSIANNLTNKTWLSGLSDAFDVVSDPERYGKNYVQRLAGSAAVPSLVNQATQATDPHLRDAQTILDAIKARVPVLSESVPARLNVWGEPIERGDAVGPDAISPFYAKRASSDPVKREMSRLQAALSKPQRFLMVDGKRVQLTPEQYGQLVQMSGQPAKQYLDGFIQTPEWRAMTDDERREEVKEVLAEFRAAARDELRMRHPELGGTTD